MLRYSKKQKANALKKKQPKNNQPVTTFPEPIPVPSPLGQEGALTLEGLYDRYWKGKPDGPPDPQYDRLIYGPKKKDQGMFAPGSRMANEKDGIMKDMLSLLPKDTNKGPDPSWRDAPPLTYETEGVCIVQAGEYRGQCYYPTKEEQHPPIGCYYHLTAEDFGEEEEEEGYEIVQPEWKAPEPLWTDGGHKHYPVPEIRDGTINRPFPEKTDN